MELEQIREQILATELVKSLPDEMRQRFCMLLLWLSETREVSREERLFTLGEQNTDTGCLILEGMVRIITEEDDKKEASCPRDRVKMEAYRRIMGELRLDMCPTCNGLWLDRGELARLRKSDDADTFDRLATRLRGLADTIRRRKPE